MNLYTQTLRAAILASIASAPMAGCGDKAVDDEEVVLDLEPMPEGDYPQCVGEETKYKGACCTDVYCADATAGECEEASSAYASVLTGQDYGSGSCLCGDSITGPFAPREGDEGDCCYLVSAQGCEGRPLMVAGQVRRARLLRGAASGAWASGRA